MKWDPINAALIQNDLGLIIGCANGFLYKYSLINPTSPKLINIINLNSHIFCFLKMNEEKLLCGQEGGYLNIV